MQYIGMTDNQAIEFVTASEVLRGEWAPERKIVTSQISSSEESTGSGGNTYASVRHKPTAEEFKINTRLLFDTTRISATTSHMTFGS